MKRHANWNLVLCFLMVFSASIVVRAAESTDKLSKKEVKELIAKATSRADHERLAVHYRLEAVRLKAEQQDHEEEAAAYFKNPSSHPSPKYPTLGQHCRDFAGYFGKAAQKATAMAEMHEALANSTSPGAGAK